ncbi:hypothetical protein BDV93DRAFT_546901 [Ceratobasidium sp. AG-I]|nr:hypothetical protein BDV93DRAFT_546901 [Ceratobasidium sp. AG-I]
MSRDSSDVLTATLVIPSHRLPIIAGQRSSSIAPALCLFGREAGARSPLDTLCYYLRTLFLKVLVYRFVKVVKSGGSVKQSETSSGTEWPVKEYNMCCGGSWCGNFLIFRSTWGRIGRVCGGEPYKMLFMELSSERTGDPKDGHRLTPFPPLGLARKIEKHTCITSAKPRDGIIAIVFD